ncbi:MAG: Decarbamoylnovobiocin carbamoyltransferase [Candidatus Omnitrophica bacterium]|nr:Decarbamoylnovobiocin carbamoyltransferase [Candidatus Omnitrophota bacterium]
MIILGLNAYHGDASACLVRDGVLIAAAEEERFRRIKHWAGLPSRAVSYCLSEAGVRLEQVDHIAVNRDPWAHLGRKLLYLARRGGVGASRLKDRARNSSRLLDLRQLLADGLGAPRRSVGAQVHRIEHHRAHLASAYLVSPFDAAAVVSVDGFGDFTSTLWGVGEGGRIRTASRTYYPHSLGLFYLALTQYLGFPNYGDEYKAMGLSAYGAPSYTDQLRRLVLRRPAGSFALGLEYFKHHTSGVEMTWEDGEPRIGTVYTDRLTQLLGPPRRPEEPIERRHQDLAASMQAVYEEAFFRLLKEVHRRTGKEALCLAGGCAMNSVANGKIYENTPFRKLYIQSAAGDAGGAIGAAFEVWSKISGGRRSFVMDHAYWGPGYESDAIEKLLRSRSSELAAQGCDWTAEPDEAVLVESVAAVIAEGGVVGWFQGRMEWGPRALGNRSILGDPRRADMKDILNLKIKRRESFRPFAPSILREAVPEWFETDDEVPFMLQVYRIRAEKRSQVPAVTHVNGTGRLQTVSASQNPRYHRLIAAYARRTGVPMVLNTSFNENEPVVCAPAEALDCFLRTRMDLLVLGDHLVRRRAAS